MFCIGFGTFARSGGFSFQSAAAEIYYEALKTANGGSETGIDDKKVAIDSMFVSLEDAGVLAKIKRFTPRIGVNLGQNAINCVNPGTYDGTFVNSPTIVADGIKYDGVNQYEDTNFLANLFASDDNIGFSFMNADETITNNTIVLRDTSTSAIYIYKHPIEYFLCFLNATIYIQTPIGGAPHFHTIQRTGTSAKEFVDGVQDDAIVVNTGTLPASSIHIALGGLVPSFTSQ